MGTVYKQANISIVILVNTEQTLIIDMNISGSMSADTLQLSIYSLEEVSACNRHQTTPLTHSLLTAIG